MHYEVDWPCILEYFNGMATSNRVNDMDGPPPKRSKPNFDAFKVFFI